MLKNILNLEGAQQLSKKEQQSVSGGWDSGFCPRLWQSGDCCSPFWTKCGFIGANYCVNGTCVI